MSPSNIVVMEAGAADRNLADLPPEMLGHIVEAVAVLDLAGWSASCRLFTDVAATRTQRLFTQKRRRLQRRVVELAQLAVANAHNDGPNDMPTSIFGLQLPNIMCVDLRTASITKIGHGCFLDCSSLESVYLPATVDTIGISAFANCPALKSIALPAGLKKIMGTAFYKSGLVNVTLPGGVHTLYDGAFAGCESLKSVTLNEGLKTIFAHVFSNCGLVNVNLPASVETIGDCAFAHCESLESITMNEGLKTILGMAFAFCSSLESVYLPRSLTHLQENGHIFDSCWNLKEIRVPKGLRGRFSADTFDLFQAKLFLYGEDGNEEHYMTGCFPAFDAIESDYDADINAHRCANFDYQAHMNAEYAAHLARLNAY